jgi:hypothetical protein
MVIETHPSDPARDDEFNRWYDEKHLPDVCAVPGIVGARRYRMLQPDGAGAAVPTYLAVYDLEADDLGTPLQELGARFADGRVPISDLLSMDPIPVPRIYELRD